MSALGAVLYSAGIPKDSGLNYEAAIKADGFLVMARGSAEEVEGAKKLLAASNPSHLDVHPSGKLEVAMQAPVRVHA